MQSGTWRFLKQTAMSVFGTGLLALGLYLFIVPNNIAPGGISGLSVIANHLFSVQIGWVNFLLNLPLLILGFIVLGRKFIIKTIISVASFTVFYDYLFGYLPYYKGETLLACLFGGTLMGFGMGLAFIAESSTGGIDISSKMLQKKMPHLSIGRLVLLSDVVVIALSAMVFNSMEGAMYAVITMFVSSKVIDAMIHGLDTGNLVLIISKQSEKIGDYLNQKLHRGVTQLQGKGVYTDGVQGVLMCAVRKSEYHRLKRLTHEIDPKAFMIVTSTTEVLGEGFKQISEADSS